MTRALPRRLIAELLTRWTLTRERLVVVEGPSDQRILGLLKREGHWGEGLDGVEIWPVDAIEVAATHLARYGLEGVGAKQRVVAFAREVESESANLGFRGIVDRDVDPEVGVDLQGDTLLYTDHGCMEGYLWSLPVLRTLVIQFGCEEELSTAIACRRMCDSVGEVCMDLASVRIVAALHPAWHIDVHHSDKALSVAGGRLSVDLAKYLLQTKPRKVKIETLTSHVAGVRERLSSRSANELMNGHDLIWAVAYVLRELSAFPRRLVSEEAVGNALIAVGVSHPVSVPRELFDALEEWADADAA